MRRNVMVRTRADPYGDVVTSRLALRIMDGEVMTACVTGALGRAGTRLGVPVPRDVLERPTSFQFGLAQLRADPEYLPWSARAVILRAENVMVGHVRFHSRPDPEYLRPYARDAVEFGYTIFERYRRHGYATEAVIGLMDWAGALFNVRRFVASIAPENLPSLRLVAGLGFTKVGEQIDDIDGLEHVFLCEIPSDPTLTSSSASVRPASGSADHS
jgi:ribosomal-protein-alanine N-acetyltransferase